MSANQSNGKARPKAKRKNGRPAKGTPNRIAAILDDIALGMTEEQAVAGNGVHITTWCDWKNKPEFEGLRAKAQYARLKVLLTKQETDPDDWRRWGWQLERIFRTQFGDPAKIGVQINQQFNNGNSLALSQAELEDARQRLDRMDLLKRKWKMGTSTNAELREIMIKERDELQRAIDCLDAGMTPVEEAQQQLYQIHKESSGGPYRQRDDRQSPIRAIEGHVTDSNDHHQLAIEDATEPERATSGTSMRASETDPSSGQRQAEPTAPPEHIRQRDRKPQAGPLSLRQSWLQHEKERRGGDGKGIF
jgi:hypothetical protein